MGVFSNFLNCKNGTKSRKASQLYYIKIDLLLLFALVVKIPVLLSDWRIYKSTMFIKAMLAYC